MYYPHLVSNSVALDALVLPYHKRRKITDNLLLAHPGQSPKPGLKWAADKLQDAAVVAGKMNQDQLHEYMDATETAKSNLRACKVRNLRPLSYREF